MECPWFANGEWSLIVAHLWRSLMIKLYRSQRPETPSPWSIVTVTDSYSWFRAIQNTKQYSADVRSVLFSGPSETATYQSCKIGRRWPSNGWAACHVLIQKRYPLNWFEWRSPECATVFPHQDQRLEQQFMRRRYRDKVCSREEEVCGKEIETGRRGNEDRARHSDS